MGIKGSLKQSKGTVFGGFQASAIKEEFPLLLSFNTHLQFFSSSQLHCIHFLQSSIRQKFSEYTHFSIPTNQDSRTSNCIKMHSACLLLGIAFGLCFFMPPLVHSVCLDLNSNDVDELLYYHNAIRASVDPQAENMRQMVCYTGVHYVHLLVLAFNSTSF